ncbi:MAG: glycosyltransferase family 2 protein [Rikenellaceae bacterium]
MILSIVTINYNDAVGLKRTLNSVLSQSCADIEHCIVDGASSDDSVDVIKWYLEDAVAKGITVKWVSERDSGIYNAMNKGIRMASGEYLQFLNSGDCLYSDSVVERMCGELIDGEKSPILYGNMIKNISVKRRVRDRGFYGRQATFLDFYTGTLNHSSAYIKRSLFDKYGLYDETLRIVSDWKWYLQVLIMGGEQIRYVDIDVTLFDMNGVSNTDSTLDKSERKQVLESMFPPALLLDYATFAFPISQIKRLKRYGWAYRIVYFFERCLFKWDKWVGSNG